MIEINLLPEVMRKKEGTPMPQMLGLIVALVLVAGMAYAVAMYITRIIPGLENDKRILQNKERELKLKEADADSEALGLNDELGLTEADAETAEARYMWSICIKCPTLPEDV